MGSQDDSGWGDPKVNAEGNSFGLERLERFSPASDLIQTNPQKGATGRTGQRLEVGFGSHPSEWLFCGTQYPPCWAPQTMQVAGAFDRFNELLWRILNC